MMEAVFHDQTSAFRSIGNRDLGSPAVIAPDFLAGDRVKTEHQPSDSSKGAVVIIEHHAFVDTKSGKWRQGEFVSHFAFIGNSIHVVMANQRRARSATRNLTDRKQNAAFIVGNEVARG